MLCSRSHIQGREGSNSFRKSPEGRIGFYHSFKFHWKWTPVTDVPRGTKLPNWSYPEKQIRCRRGSCAPVRKCSSRKDTKTKWQNCRGRSGLPEMAVLDAPNCRTGRDSRSHRVSAQESFQLGARLQNQDRHAEADSWSRALPTMSP